MCQFCEKTFTRKTGLTKHLKCCKQKKIFEEEKHEKMTEKDNEIKELKNIVEKLLGKVEEVYAPNKTPGIPEINIKKAYFICKLFFFKCGTEAPIPSATLATL